MQVDENMLKKLIAEEMNKFLSQHKTEIVERAKERLEQMRKQKKRQDESEA